MGSSKEDEQRDLQVVPSMYKSTWLSYIMPTVKEDMEQEMPQHPVHIDYSFGLGTYPVTRGEFAAFVQETGYKSIGACVIYFPARNTYRIINGKNWQDPGFDQTSKDPVVCVSKPDAEAYIAWLNTKVHAQPSSARGGVFYRLPSEAEWEYAARAGTKTAYSWGDSIGDNNAVCKICGSRWDNKRTAPVGSFAANPFGLYDMLGNVWEVTADCWRPDYVGVPADGKVWLAEGCPEHVMRGGSWGADVWNLRSASRGEFGLGGADNNAGFRVARNLSQ